MPKRFTLYLDDEVVDKFKRYAESKNIKYNSLFRKMFELYEENISKKDLKEDVHIHVSVKLE